MTPARLAILLLSCILLTVPAVQASPMDARRTAAWFEAHRQRTPMLRQFLQRMPKGADLHSHISGAVYAETYLQWAAAAGYCVDTQALTILPTPCSEAGNIVLASNLTSTTYSALVDRMSTRNLAYAGRPGHDQFFNAFTVFGPASGMPGHLASMVAELADRAAAQHTQHLELMSTFQGGAVRKLGSGLPWRGDKSDMDFALRHQWLMDNGLYKLVEAGRSELDQLDVSYGTLQGCGTPAAKPACGVSIRWLQQTTRTGPPEQVFAQLTYAFELARADKRVAGLNLVAPEDDPVALRDYHLQMEMIGFLSRLAPDVKIALHAGELAMGMVPPDKLRSHIRDAVMVAGAQRIGHAVDIGYEEGAHQLLQTMKEKGVAVEICLSSNDIILGVKGKDHPLPDYLAAGVPVVLASDDEGVSRIDLSHEYLRAARDYGLSYRQLKQISRNSLSYSFLPGPSLWQDPAIGTPDRACQKDALGAAKPSQPCSAFLLSSERATRQWALESAFKTFEKLQDWRKAQ